MFVKVTYYSFAALLMTVFLVGFRVAPGQAVWGVTKVDNKIWLDFCEKPDLKKNDLPSADAYSGSSLVLNDMIDSVIEDYNGISAAFFSLADADRDSDYSTTAGEDRTIEICFGDPSGLSGGEALPIHEAGQLVGCNIVLLRESLESAKDFVAVLTHELGHCLGLDHPQEVTHSIMSYFNSDDIYRLAPDDKAGLIYLYPMDAAKSKETATFGASCSPSS